MMKFDVHCAQCGSHPSAQPDESQLAELGMTVEYEQANEQQPSGRRSDATAIASGMGRVVGAVTVGAVSGAVFFIRSLVGQTVATTPEEVHQQNTIERAIRNSKR
jgi:hypothetical protein